MTVTSATSPHTNLLESGTRMVPLAVVLGSVLLLSCLWTGGSPAREWQLSLRVKGGAHIPTDQQLRDLYGWIPEAGLVVQASGLGWSQIEVEGAIRWASARPAAGPFVEETESRWLSVPLSISLRRGLGDGPIKPFGRLGVLGQWNRESFDTRIGGDQISQSSSQFRPGLLVGAGVGSRGPGLHWYAEGSWHWTPGDRVVVSDSRSRRTEGMNLGGFSVNFGVGIR